MDTEISTRRVFHKKQQNYRIVPQYSPQRPFPLIPLNCRGVQASSDFKPNFTRK